LGARSILFTGGEPLLCDHIERLARSARDLGLSVQVATNGLGLSRCSDWVADVVDEVYVSLEGPEDVHDQMRGERMFSRLAQSIRGLRALAPRPRLIGRSVISAANAARLDATVAAARTLGLDAISFLPIDVTSAAFGGDPAARESLRPGRLDVLSLRSAIDRLESSGALGAFVLEDSRKLREIADSFLLEPEDRVAPPCDAPEWSSVVEADGALRPCFFQSKVGSVSVQSLSTIRKSPEYAAALQGLGPRDRTCESCVCPKHAGTRIGALRGRVARTLERAAPGLFQRAGSAL
jgi:MoaA/NifB/PqqE/SkfB family radical SAM enzyme